MAHIDNSPLYEERTLRSWFSTMESQFRANPKNELPDQRLWAQVMGFDRACRCIYARLWEDIQEYLPKVQQALSLTRTDLERRLRELKMTAEEMNPEKMERTLILFIQALSTKMVGYTEGFDDIGASPDVRTTLCEEIEDAADSDCNPLFNVAIRPYSTHEPRWMEKVKAIASQLADSDNSIRSDTPTFGPRQFPRAIAFFELAVSEGVGQVYCGSSTLHDLIGYNVGGVVAPNWEYACRGLMRKSADQVVHPAINVAIKHQAFNMYRYLEVAWDHVTRDDVNGKAFAALTPMFFSHINSAYISFLEQLTITTASNCHTAIAPLFQVILTNLHNKIERMVAASKADGGNPDPDGPSGGFNFGRVVKNFIPKDLYDLAGGRLDNMLQRVAGHVGEVLAHRVKELHAQKGQFMSAERTPVVTDEEIKRIVDTTYTYMHAILENVFIQFETSFNWYFLHQYRSGLERSLHAALSSRELNPEEAFDFNVGNTQAAAQETEQQLDELKNLIKKLQSINSNGRHADDAQAPRRRFGGWYVADSVVRSAALG